jgi:beta-barrel assembly-enhancing protease
MFLRRSPMGYGGGGGIGGGGLKARLIIALVIAAFAYFSYLGKQEHNPFTGEKQAVAMSKSEEIALGLNAAPQMAQEFGGLDANAADQARVKRIGARLLAGDSLQQSDYRYDFHLLADPQTINAFALPGGQIFITRALYDKLKTDAEIAGVLGHEIGHVVGRHGAERLAKQQLTQGLAGAAGVAAGDHSGQQMAMMIGQVVNMKYGREDELQSDTLGVRFMVEAGYDPRALLAVMKVLMQAGGGKRQPAMFSTHPNPENRVEVIEAAITQIFPNGVPSSFEK